jgi:hypothetical protein
MRRAVASARHMDDFLLASILGLWTVQGLQALGWQWRSGEIALEPAASGHLVLQVPAGSFAG